ncbi:MAG: hypothetical protein IT449_16245 [Phycisphaerales bacterium]|nr:hypothetical protein [Phycisphaerales bacterium]
MWTGTRLAFSSLGMLIALVLTGCATYVTPGRGAAMSSLTGADYDIRQRMSREPAASFPARIALVRVQAQEYRSYRTEGCGRGAYTVVFTREFEKDDDIARLKNLPMVAGVAVLNRLVMPAELKTDHELRLAAADLKADLLLVYTLDDTFRIDEHDIGALTLISLGIAPTKEAKVTATASAALFDVRTGFVYGLAEGTAHDSQLASAWNSGEAVDTSRLRAERKAFEQMLGEFEKTWAGVIAEHAAASQAAQASP